MGPAPDLATYQATANAIYEPQKQADITTAKANEAANVANEEALKPQVQTDYQQAIDNLTQQTNKNVGTINQLYTLRLGGNFSGLQGNDLGMMFSNAGKQQAVIETTRANKLAEISTTETNLANQLNADISSISSKYQGEEQNYAASSYASAVKDYQTQQQREFDNQLALQKLAISQSRAASAARSAASSANSLPSKQDVTSMIQQGLQKVTGKDGYVSPQDYAAGLQDWLAAGLTRSDYNKQYSSYRNPNNPYYDYAVKQAGL